MKKTVASVLIMAMLGSMLPAAASAETTGTGVPAFPGAEGGGKYTTGGRGGAVYEVTTLADSGPGSLREAVSGSNRTVVFKVGGTIHLLSPLKITGSNLTIAGQTAPGEGITVADYTTSIDGDNLIVRYLRFRLGDRSMSEDDAFGGRYHKNIIIDHCSFSWSVDEVMSMYENENTTVQWSIMSESMLMTTHVKGRHGYGGIWGGRNATFHHNLVAHNVSRNPRLAATSAADKTDAYNNVIYDWGFFSSYGGGQGNFNLRNNYYKYGPSTYKNARSMVFVEVLADSRMYIGGNYMDGNPEVTADNWKGVGALASPEAKLAEPVAMAWPVQLQTAEEAYASVLAGAGAVLPRRDAVDARVISDVKNRTGEHINSQKEVGGYLEFEQAAAPLADGDHDGMPDSWESQHGLNPAEAADGSLLNAEGYTNLEVYLNGISGNGSANPAAAITAPAHHTIVEAGSDVTVQAEASDPDGTVAKVQFYLGDVLLGEDTAAPYSLTWTKVTDGTHDLTVRAVDNTGTSVQSNRVTVHVNTSGSTAPWEAKDIGTPGIAGHTQLGASPAEVTVKAAGAMGGRADAFHFAYQPLTGNGEIVARIEKVTGTDDGAEAGVMIRENLTASSRMAALLIPYVKNGRKGVTLTRTAEGGQAAKMEPDEFISVPYWVKAVRLGSQFTTLVSKSGVDWTVAGTASIPMGETAYFGLAADAADADDDIQKYNTSLFSGAALRPLPADYPAAPQEVQATAGVKQAVLSWSPVTTAQSYTVKRSELPGGPYSAVAQGLTQPSFTDTGLSAGLTYYYVVTAVNAQGESFSSAEVSVEPSGSTGTVYLVNDSYEGLAEGTLPAGYTVTPDPQDADHKVGAVPMPAGTTGNATSAAMIVYDNAAGNTQFVRKFAPQTGAVVIETDVTSAAWPGTSIVLQLQDEAGTKTPLSVELRKPTQPAAESTNTFIYKKLGADYKLSEPPVNNRWYHLKIVANVPAQKADIYIDEAPAALGVDFQADVSAAGIGRILAKTPGTGKGTMYYDNLKVYVEPVATPQGVTAVPGNGKVQLSWTVTAGAASYTVKRAEASGGPYAVVAAEVTGTGYIDEGVTNGTTYYYVVTASGPSGESGPSSTVTVTPSEAAVKPAAPAGLTAQARSTQADLSWQPAAGASHYTVKRSASAAGPFTAIAAKVLGTSFRDGALTNGTVYYYTVSASSVGGEGPDAPAVPVRPEAALGTPAVKGTAGAGRIRLSWDAVEGASSYEVKRAASLEGPYEAVATTAELAYAETGLPEGTPYYYTVTARSGESRSLASDPAAVRASSADGAPAVPQGMRAEPGDGETALFWTVAAGAEAYAVKRSESPAGGYETVAARVEGTAYRDTGLVNGRTYYYLVTAVNAAGESGSSAPVQETPAPVLTVAADGSGMYTRVQDAINAVPDNGAGTTVIQIKDGVYREKLNIPAAKTKIRMIGGSREGTVLIYGDSAKTLDAAGRELGTSGSASFTILANDFSAENLTIANDAGQFAGQAVALYTKGDRMFFRNVTLTGYQDTFYANDGRQVFADSRIEGTVDYIFGSSSLVFENCVIHSFAGGYVTAASTPEGKSGYLFLNSRLTAEPGLAGTVALGRPWRPYAKVSYVNTCMDDHIRPTGWDNWGNSANELTASYNEYGSYGPGAKPQDRYRWSKQLTVPEAEALTPEAVIGGSDGWNPLKRTPLLDGSALLSSLAADGVTVPGFRPDVTEYGVLLPAGTGTAPTVTAAVYAASSAAAVTQAAALPGTASVKVTAQDGTVRTYLVRFEAEAVIDREPPTATVTYSAYGPTNGSVTATLVPSEPVTVTNNNGSLTRVFQDNGSFTFTFVDAAGNKGSAKAVVSVIDKKAPALNLTVDKPVLWPPNHKLIPVHVTVKSTDTGSGIASVVLKSITSSEGDKGLGAGDQPGDIREAAFGTKDTDFLLRAERYRSRVYTITYTAEDRAGNRTEASVKVTVKNP
ncbi:MULTISPECIES: pectinesterase family protein [Paenibacillus]|uniref:pectinesterase family protein n=1 Tax=Paenibacillus TaxID=44249 RepID=UPI0022B86C42|nr:pectinesterase family protein [Paenibacillus caseinilyticus]MCZ8518566.1 pectinesterase family protein [Paenibacillus caseinilyticus]